MTSTSDPALTGNLPALSAEQQALLRPEVQDFLATHAQADPSALMLQAKRFPELPMQAVVAQLQARQKARQKLPTYSQTPGVLFPPLLSLEQSSSEATAAFKASLVSGSVLADLTGGFGVDTYFFSKHVAQVHYVERQPQLAALVQHNLQQLGVRNVNVHATTAEAFLEALQIPADWLYLDPARRNPQQEKVYRLEETVPDVLALRPLLLQKGRQVLLKTAPLLDIDLALKQLQLVHQVWVVALENEVKEVLYHLAPDPPVEPQLHAVALSRDGHQQVFSFSRSEEQSARPDYAEPQAYLYEPNAALLKAGAFKIIAERLHLQKLHPHSHLYTAAEFLSDFPGRSFRVLGSCRYHKKELQALLPAMKANLTARNFPDTVAAARKKLGLAEGGVAYLFATTFPSGKPMLVLTEKVQPAS